jgi:hypothetical protein
MANLSGGKPHATRLAPPPAPRPVSAAGREEKGTFLNACSEPEGEVEKSTTCPTIRLVYLVFQRAR